MPFINTVRGTIGIQSIGMSTGKKGLSSASPALTATEIYNSGTTTNGVYWLKPTGAPSAFQAYIDFTTANGPWVNVGTAAGGTMSLWAYTTTWKERTTDSGTFTDPTNATTSSFNAGAFIYCKGNQIMLKEGGGNGGAGGSVGYVQCTGFTNESWRDVYNAAITSMTSWPAQPSVYRMLPISVRSPGLSTSNLIYGTTYNAVGTYDGYGVWGFDTGGDTFGHLVTNKGSVNDAGVFNESDIGIGANEYGPGTDQQSVGGTPANPKVDNAANTFDAGANGSAAGLGPGAYLNIPYSMWIKN